MHREGGVSSGLYMGKRLSRNSLYLLDGKIFERRLLRILGAGSGRLFRMGAMIELFVSHILAKTLMRKIIN